MNASPPRLPQSMRVIEITASRELALATRPLPRPQPGEVLIKVVASGLNRADILQRLGRYPPPPAAPEWPGLEVSGTVVAAAADVREFTVGDEVCALLQGGGYAEYCCAPVGQCLPVPQGVVLRDAASLPEACFTVWSNLYEFARLRAGETLLVHGGSSGIGVTAIQLATLRGSSVYVTAGSAEKCAFCVSLGARAAFDYRDVDFVAAVHEATGGRGVDVILDMVGGSYAQRNLDALAIEGRIVTIATQGGAAATFDLHRLMAKRAVVTGSTLRGREVAFKARMKAQLASDVWPLVASGALRPVIDSVFPAERAAEAHALMESSTHRGKILLAW